MDFTSYYAFLGVAVGFFSTVIVPKAISMGAAKRVQALASIFLGFFAVSLWFHLTFFSSAGTWNGIGRSVAVGVIPIVGGYVFWYFTRDSRR